MLVAAVVIASLLGGMGAWLAYRRQQPAMAMAHGPGKHARAAESEAADVAVACAEAGRIELANELASTRLWNLAFGAAVNPQRVAPEQARIRACIEAILEADILDEKYFPRRPTLLPQLLRALDDPSAAPGKLSRIVAHDPVLTADVLRLANSSLYRTSTAPIETIQRALVVLGVDALRGLIAAAMLQPVFRATRTNFPRFPRMLWERTERAAHAAELYALITKPQDRFEAQLIILLSALGPLVVYGAAVEVYSRNPKIAPNAELLVALIGALAPRMSLRIARHWEASARLISAIDRQPGESLTQALYSGELVGTLSLLQSQNVVPRAQALAMAKDAGMTDELLDTAWLSLA